MAIDRGLRAKLRYRSDEFLSGGAGRQLLFLFALTMGLVTVFAVVSVVISTGPDNAEGAGGILERTWFYFGRMLDAGTMADDGGTVNRFISTMATIMGVVVAGLLISSLAGNFQDRLEAIKRGGSPVMEEGHFLVLGWSEKIYSVIDQIGVAYPVGDLVVVVMAEGDKVEMEEKLRDKIADQGRIKVVVRSGSSMSLNDLARVSFDKARAIVVLIEERDADAADKADGRIIKTLLALYNHPDHPDPSAMRVTAELMLPANHEIALIASGGKANVVKTNEIISRILLQTSRIGGLSLVYDELLRFEGNEMHIKSFPVTGKRFGDLLLDFPNGLLVGVAQKSGEGHHLNPPADHVIAENEALLILAEDPDIRYHPRGPLDLSKISVPGARPEKPVEQLLVLGWNSKVFPILEEFDNYVGAGSKVMLVNTVTTEERQQQLTEKCAPFRNVELTHLVGEFTSRKLMADVHPERFPTVMVLADATGAADAEESDTRAIIALLLLRDFRRRAGIDGQEVCSEILDPKNRELAATTEIRDVVISNEMVSMVLAQITYEPRIRPVLEDLFSSDGSEIYLKDLALYAPLGKPTTFEHLVMAACVRGEAVMGLQIHEPDAARRWGIVLNPPEAQRTAQFVPKSGDRLVVLAEDDG